MISKDDKTNIESHSRRIEHSLPYSQMSEKLCTDHKCVKPREFESVHLQAQPPSFSLLIWTGPHPEFERKEGPVRNALRNDRHTHRSLGNLSVVEHFFLVEPSNSEAQGAIRCAIINN